MPHATTLTGADLLSWAESATKEIVARRAEINALNVFPVPDADTGSNMAHTMEAALTQARSQATKQLSVESLADAIEDDMASLRARDVATALSVGAVRGARGNSGVVLSQVLRGLAQAAHEGTISGKSVTTALSAALAFVTRAISDPVEGTVITVLRAASIAAAQSGTEDLATVTRNATHAARIALAKTPSQLPALREAGVVDAGGQGLVILLETLLAEITGEDVNIPSMRMEDHSAHKAAEQAFPQTGKETGSAADSEQSSTTSVTVSSTAPDHVDQTSFASNEFSIPGVGDFALGKPKTAMLEKAENFPTPECDVPDEQVAEGDGPYLEVMYYIEGADIDALERAISPLGDCLVIARLSDTNATVHIHSRQSGAVIEKSFGFGTVTDLRIEVLPDSSGAKAPHSGQKRLVIAVTPPGNLAELYREAGAVVITRASEAEDVVQQIVSEARQSGAQEIILLPNGLLDKEELASAERLSLAFEQSITLLPTMNLVRGLAAIAMHDPSQPLAVDTYAMAEAAAAMRVAQIVYAKKARLTQAGPCSKDDFLAQSGEETIVVGEDIMATVIAACRRLLDSTGERVTLLVDADLISEITQEKVRAGMPPHRDVDVVVYPADNLRCLVEIGVE